MSNELRNSLHALSETWLGNTGWMWLVIVLIVAVALAVLAIVKSNR